MTTLRSPNAALGISYMIFSCLCFAVMSAIIRYLSTDMHPFEMVFYRNGFALLCVLPLLVRPGLDHFRTRAMPFHVLRALSGVIGMLLWFYGLSLIPLPDAVSLSFTVPLITALAAILILGERMGSHRWAALGIGFFGVIVILRPGTEDFNATYLWVLAATCAWSMSNILMKHLSHTESSRTIVFYMYLFMTPLSLPFALPFLTMPTMEQWLWLAFLGFVSISAQLSFTKSVVYADITLLAPFDFTRLLFAIIIGYFAFEEVLTYWSAVGAVIILSSSVYITYQEARGRALSSGNG